MESHPSFLSSARRESFPMPERTENPRDGVQYFMSQSWCAKLLTSSTNLVVHTSENRVVLPFDENHFVAKTINTSDTVAAWIVFYERPQPPEFKIDCYQALVALEKGIIGFPGYCHGGVIALIFDEITGMHVVSQRRPGTIGDKSWRTAYLNVTYIRPVPAPSTILVKSWITRVQGRKTFIKALMEDEQGNALAKSEALYISIKGIL
jgi:acyl-coenzyme A thioesterase PaaI-like protein